MQVSGKILVLTTFAIGFALAAGAWWFNYLQSYRAAEFWRGGDAELIIGGPEVTLFEVGDSGPNGVLGREVIRKFSLNDKPGLAHLRHALTYDANFDWDEKPYEPFGTGKDWPYALKFARDDRETFVLFSRTFDRLGRLVDAASGTVVDVLPCPRLGPVIIRYLGEIGIKLKGEQVGAREDAR